MTDDAKKTLDLLERRIALLGSLAQALSAASASAAAFDIDGLESRICEQERLCAEIGALDARLDRVQRVCAEQVRAGNGSPSLGDRGRATAQLREAAARLQAAQAHVRKLNDAHQALMARSRRTIGALLHSYHSFVMETYAKPEPAVCSMGERA